MPGTGLPVLADAKSYLRQTDTTAEDALIGQLLDRALGLAQAYISRPIVAIAQTFVVEGQGLVKALAVPANPVDLTQPVTVVDGAGLTLDPTLYRVNAQLGTLRRTASTTVLAWACDWNVWPYTVTWTWGLSARSDYDLVVAPAVGAAILDTVSDLFQRRNPGASAESAGGGVSATWAGARYGLTTRACALLDPFRMATV